MSVILQKDEPVLRKTAKDVPVSEIKSPKIQGVLKRMREALEKEYDGVGLAAPQIGESLRIFIISDLVFKAEREQADEDRARMSTGTGAGTKIQKNKKENLVFINPTLVKVSKDRRLMEEGCLSVRPLYGKVKRASKATVRAYNEKGEPFERGGSGLLAQIFQHEVDHLDGILFIDHAKETYEMEPDRHDTDADHDGHDHNN